MFELGIQKNWIDALCARSSVRQYIGVFPQFSDGIWACTLICKLYRMRRTDEMSPVSYSERRME